MTVLPYRCNRCGRTYLTQSLADICEQMDAHPKPATKPNLHVVRDADQQGKP